MPNKWRLINYFDVWGNEKDGWDVNDCRVERADLEIADGATDKEILEMLKEIGFLSTSDRRRVRIADGCDRIEIEAVKGYKPLGALERINEGGGIKVNENKEMQDWIDRIIKNEIYCYATDTVPVSCTMSLWVKQHSTASSLYRSIVFILAQNKRNCNSFEQFQKHGKLKVYGCGKESIKGGQNI